MSIIIPEFRRPQAKEVHVSDKVERVAVAVGEAMFAYRKGRTLMAWGCSPERTEAIRYVRAMFKIMGISEDD